MFVNAQAGEPLFVTGMVGIVERSRGGIIRPGRLVEIILGCRLVRSVVPWRTKPVKKHRVTQLVLMVLAGLWAGSEACADRGLNFSPKGPRCGKHATSSA